MSDQSSLFKSHNENKNENSAKPQRVMQDLAQPMDRQAFINSLKSTGRVIVSNSKKNISVYIVHGQNMTSEVLKELGLAREKSFRTVGEGSGKESDFDEFDKNYHHLIAIDDLTHTIIGGYRLGEVGQIMDSIGIDGVYSSHLFNNQELLSRYKSQILELGRSFADYEAGKKALHALDILWDGITQFIIENPQYRYLIGPVSISDDYSEPSKNIMLKYLNKFRSEEFSDLITGKNPIKFDHQFDAEFSLVAEKMTDFKELNQIVNDIDLKSIPSLLISYAKLGAKYLAFSRDVEFNTIDGLIVVDLLAKDSNSETQKRFGENWDNYVKYHTP